MSILRRSKTKLTIIMLLALLIADGARAESSENKITDPAKSHAAGPDKVGTPESGGVPYAASPETAGPGVSPKVPAQGTSAVPAQGESPGGTTTVKVAPTEATPAQAPTSGTSPTPELPGSAIPSGDGLAVPTGPTNVQLQSMPVPGDANAHQPPPSSGKPQIGLQFPSHNQLGSLLRINPMVARSWIKASEAHCRKLLIAAGMDPNISVDDAMALSKPVINIYCKKIKSDNIMAHGFAMEAYLVQYQKKPSGRIDTVRCARIGESPGGVYNIVDFEKKVAMLVEVYISARHHQLKENAVKKGKPVAKGKKTK